jgi:hypothetical protein
LEGLAGAAAEALFDAGKASPEVVVRGLLGEGDGEGTVAVLRGVELRIFPPVEHLAIVKGDVLVVAEVGGVVEAAVFGGADAAESPLIEDELFGEEGVKGGGRSEGVEEGLTEGLELLFGFVEVRQEEGLGEDAVLDGVESRAVFAVVGTRTGGEQRIAPIGSDLFG